MESEAGFILQGISLSDLKVKQQHLNSPHCLRAGSLELDPRATARCPILTVRRLVRLQTSCCLTLFKLTLSQGCVSFGLFPSTHRASPSYFDKSFICCHEAVFFPFLAAAVLGLPFPFTTGGCDARMWTLRSGPRWAGVAPAACWVMASGQWPSWQSLSLSWSQNDASECAATLRARRGDRC